MTLQVLIIKFSNSVLTVDKDKKVSVDFSSEIIKRQKINIINLNDTVGILECKL